MDRAAFWRENHLAKGDYWLTGSHLPDLLSLYEIDPPSDLDITEIGVGLRRMTEALARNNRVTAVDIVEEAIAPTRAYATALLTTDLQKAAPADLVFCHLVFQHCDSDEVGRLLQAPLKPGGMFAFQTAYLISPDDGEWDPLRIVWHPRGEVIGLAKAAGLVPFWERSREYPWENSRVGWTWFKCKKEKTDAPTR